MAGSLDLAFVPQSIYKTTVLIPEIETPESSDARGQGSVIGRCATTYWPARSHEVCANPISPYQGEQFGRLIGGRACYLRVRFEHLGAGTLGQTKRASTWRGVNRLTSMTKPI